MDTKAVVRELPSALAMATLTAVVTLLLAIGLSWLVGAEQRDMRAESRCYQANMLMYIHEIHAVLFDYDHEHGMEAEIALSEDCVLRLEGPR